MRQGRCLWVLLLIAAMGLGNAVVTAAQGDKQTAAGLVGCWAFDEGQGDVAKDSSGRGRDGRIQAGQWVRSRFGTALRFDGERSYVALPPLAELDGAEEMTITVWVFWEGMGRYPNILTGGAWNPGGFLLFVCDDACSFRMGKPGPAAWDIGRTWQETSASLLPHFELGRWYQLAATFRRPAITTYVNGKPTGAANWNFPVGQTGEICVGKWALDMGKTQSHCGMIADLRIYTRALTAEEIKAGYDKGESGRR